MKLKIAIAVILIIGIGYSVDPDATKRIIKEYLSDYVSDGEG